MALVATIGTYSALSDREESAQNAFESGVLSITDNDASAAMFEVRGLAAGETVQKCLRVINDGTLPAKNMTFEAIPGTSTSTQALSRYLSISVERGIGETPFASCDEFAALDEVYVGTLEDFPTDAAPISQDGELEPGEYITYRFTVGLLPDQAAQGLDYSDHAWRFEVTS